MFKMLEYVLEEISNDPNKYFRDENCNVRDEW